MSNASVSNMRMTFDELMGISERVNTTTSEGAKSSETQRKRTVSAEHTWTLERRLAEVKLPAIPPMAKAPTQKQIKSFIQPVLDNGRILPIGALPRDQLDPRTSSKKNKQLANFTTNEMVFSHFGKDGAFMTLAKQLKVEDFADDAEMQSYVGGLVASAESIGSSGTMVGLLTRLKSGITAANAPPLMERDYVRYARSILTYKPIDLDFVGKSVVEMINEVKTSKDFTFNAKSSAGIPYFKKVGDPGVIPMAVAVASTLLNAFAEGSMNTLNTERPSLFAVMLKNKLDIYELAKLEEKVRPYFVYPLHERLLYSIMQCRLKAVRFDERSDGVSAVGFSWNYGGGDRMYKWITERVQEGFGFYPLMYGDDQLWVVVLETGIAFICTPDFSHMDLSLAPIWGKVAYQIWRKSYSNLDRTWEQVLKMNCYRAFTRPVVVDGALAYLFKYGLASGIPGTTKFDEVASASVNGYIKEKYDEEGRTIGNAEELQKWLDALVPIVRQRFGLVFKEGSMDMQPFFPGQPEYNFRFLGQTLVRMRGASSLHYVPKPDLARILLSASTIKKSYRSTNIKQRAIATKLRSLYAGGGYLFRGASVVLERYFEVLAKAGIHPLGINEEEYGEETEGDAFSDEVNFDGDHWPTAEFCLNLYLPPDDQVQEHTGISVEERMSSCDAVELADFTVDLDGFTASSEDEGLGISMGQPSTARLDETNLREALQPKSWVDQEALERLPLDVGGDLPKAPKEVPVKHQAETQPLPQSVKDAHDKARQEEREAIKALRPAPLRSAGKKAGPKGKPSKPSGKGKRSGAAIMEGDFDYSSGNGSGSE